MQTTSTYPKGVLAFFAYVVLFAGSVFVGFPEYKPPFAGLITVVATVTTVLYVKDWWLLATTTEAVVGMLTPGDFVKIKGTAEPDGDLQTAPDGTECAFWRYILQYRDYDTDGGESWSAVGSGVGEPYFVVNDGTGEVLVDGGAEATYHLDTDDVTDSEETLIRIDEGSRELPQVREILDSHDPPEYGDLRLSVSHIEQGEDVFVLGRVDTVTRSDGGAEQVVTRDDDRDVFIVADSSETHVSWMKKWAILFHLAVAIGASYWTVTLLSHWPISILT